MRPNTNMKKNKTEQSKQKKTRTHQEVAIADLDFELN